MTFSEKLKELRLLKGLTIPELSDDSGIPKPTVVDYLVGRRDPSALNLFRLAQALGVSCEVFKGCTSSVEEFKPRDKPGRPRTKRRRRE